MHAPLMGVLHAQVFVVGPMFKGVKMLPPGPHIVSYNAAGTGGSGDFAPTVSFFVHLAAQHVVVRRWDAAEELLLPMQDSDEVFSSPGTRTWLLTSLLLPSRTHADWFAAGEARRRAAMRRRCAALTLTRRWPHTT